MFNAYSNATDFRPPEPQLQQSIPTDPRARNLIHQVLGKKAMVPGRSQLHRTRRGSTEPMGSLYWLLRWARPAQVCLTGCPGDGELLLIAAAVADAGGKRLVVETRDQRAAERLWPLVASAGLDWLVRFEDNAPNQPWDCRILANSAAVRALVASDPESERRQARLLIGLGDELASKARDSRALEEKLKVRGFHAIIPPRSDERFWAAVHVEQDS